ncbi:MAG: putative immunity protein, partial [Syntrophorhabdus sp.]
WYIDDKKRRRVQVQFAVLCAESVLHIYENQYPDDNRPRKAIEAAQNYLKKPSNAAAYAANEAAYEAYEAYAAKAAYEAAKAAAYAAKAANVEIDFCALADQAVKMEDNN